MRKPDFLTSFSTKINKKAQSAAEYILVVFLAGLGAITALNILQLALSASFLSFVGKFAVEIK